MNKKLQRLFPHGTTINSRGNLVIGGCDSLALAKKYGTPLYILDEGHIRARCFEFKNEFTSLYPNTKVAYASKACLNTAVARIIQKENLELDVVSGGELSIAVSAGFDTEKVYFHGNNKSIEELQYAFGQRIGHIVADNLSEIEIINNLVRETGHCPDVLLRINPGVDAHTHKHITTGSKFGLPLEDAETAIKKVKELDSINLKGLHCHLGSQIHQTQPYEEAIKIIIDFANQMYTQEGFELQKLSVGGGFGVNYTQNDETLPVKIYAGAIIKTLKEACALHSIKLPDLIIEPGRAIIAQAGVTLYRVGMLKNIGKEKKYVTIDGGMADNIRPALYDAGYTAVAAGRMFEEPTQKVSIAGKYCESGDILINEIMMPQVNSGDIIAVPATGAYCLPMASNYNGALKPAVIIISDGESHLICRREEYSDLVRLDTGWGR